jgi:hypothetical protein
MITVVIPGVLLGRWHIVMSVLWIKQNASDNGSGNDQEGQHQPCHRPNLMLKLQTRREYHHKTPGIAIPHST